MSARYPADTQDALFMDDGPASAWWDSPDIWINTPGGTVADEGANTINLRLHLAREKTFADSQAEVEVFVGNPSLVMTPTAGTVNLGSVLVAKTAFPAGGGTKDAQLPWTVPANPTGIVGAGHRCLIARVYPFSSSKPSDFQVVADQHEAQRNICIVSCGTEGGGAGGAGGGLAGAPGGEPMGPGDDGLWEFRVDTTALGKRAERVTLRVTRPPALAPERLKAIRTLLKRSHFRGFAKQPPKKFLLEAVGKAAVDDVRESMTAKPKFELDVKLQPKRMVRFGLKVDMSKTSRGQAQVFELEQIGSKKKVQGGVTVVLVKVD